MMYLLNSIELTQNCRRHDACHSLAKSLFAFCLVLGNVVPVSSAFGQTFGSGNPATRSGSPQTASTQKSETQSGTSGGFVPKPAFPTRSNGVASQGVPPTGGPTAFGIGKAPPQDSPPQNSALQNSPRTSAPRVASNVGPGITDGNGRSQQPAGEEFSPGTVLANVGGFPIFKADVIADINQLIEMQLASAPESVKAKQREMALPFAVDRAIEQKLLYADAVRTLPERDKLQEIKQSIREQFPELRLPEMLKNLKVENPVEAENKLRALGTSLRRVRESWVDSQFAGYFVRDKIDSNPEITHFEMLEHYNENRDDYYLPAQARWEQIMVRFDKQGGRQAAWDRLGELGNEIIFGANLAAVARKSSDGFEAANGGYYDWTTKGSLVHEKVDEAIFSLPINKLSDRIESKIGFHIIRVLERREEGHIPFSKAQAEIKEDIRQKKQNESLKKYVEKLKKEIPVERYIKSPTLQASK